VFINRLSIDLDEPFSIFHAQKNFNELSTLFIDENNPPLHFYLLHFWIKIFGISPISVRSLSLVFSILTLPLLFQIGKSMRNEILGLLLMLLFTCSNFHHIFGIEARAYPVFSFLFAALILVLMQVSNSASWQKGLALGGLCALLFYTHYIAILVIPFLFGIHFILSIKEKSTKSWLSFIAMLLLFFLLLSAYFPIFMARLEHVQEAGTWVQKPHISLLYGMINKFFNGPLVLLSLFVILVSLIALKKFQVSTLEFRQWKSPIAIVSILTFGVYFTAFVVSIVGSNSVFLDRYLHFLSIGFYIILGYIVLLLYNKNLKIVAVPLTIFVLGFNPFKTHNRESDKLVYYAKSFNGSYIITPTHYDLTFIYHANPELFKSSKSGYSLFAYNIYPIHGLHEIDVNQLKKPIVLIDAGAEFLYGERQLLQQLSNKFSKIEARTFKGGYEVIVFN
jgi:mannosyltransferase